MKECVKALWKHLKPLFEVCGGCLQGLTIPSFKYQTFDSGSPKEKKKTPTHGCFETTKILGHEGLGNYQKVTKSHEENWGWFRLLTEHMYKV